MQRTVICLLFLWLRQTGAAPSVFQPACATSCRRSVTDWSGPAVKWSMETSLHYNFDFSSVTSIEGTSVDSTLLRIMGKAILTPLSPCELSLILQDVSFSDNSKSIRDIQELENKEVIFSWENGLIGSLCPLKDDPAWSVNIKRSVISMIQSNTGLKEETDINGRCPTHHTLEKRNGEVLVTKRKTLESCKDRQWRSSMIHSVPYFVPSSLQSIPLMNSDSSCEQKIKDEVIREVTCMEAHLFRPFSNNQTGAQTTITTNLSLEEVQEHILPRDVLWDNRIHSTLLFDQSESKNAEDSPITSIRNILSQLCVYMLKNAVAEVPALFSKLVYEMRKTVYEQLRDIHRSLDSAALCQDPVKLRSIMYDGLPLVGNAGSVRMMVKILEKRRVTGHMATMWYTSLSFIKYPCLKAIAATYPLLEKTNPMPEAMLGISGMINRYCQKDKECHNKPEINGVVKKIGQFLGQKCNSNKEEQIIYTLRALGNIITIPSEVQLTVNECAKDVTKSTSVRLAAIQAYRNDPCATQMKKMSLELLSGEDDSEIRIAAYIAIMRCLSFDDIRTVKKILMYEKDRQVASFISSHLSNLRESASPVKATLRETLENLQVIRQVDSDFRTTSQNVELSYFSDAVNAGLTVDGNIIFSPKSYIPRSALLNLTVDMFGQSINLFEIGGRLEGTEQFIESLFGPKGYFSEQFISDVVKGGDEKVWGRFLQTVRHKRSLLHDDLQSFHDKVRGKYNFSTPLIGDWYLRLFGTEVMSYALYDGSHSLNMDDILDKMFSFVDSIVNKAKNFKTELSRSVMFLDSALYVATGMGVPLRLAVNGTISLALKLENKVNVAQIMEDHSRLDLKSKIIPRAATEISCMMTMDSQLFKSGLKLISTMHTSTAVDVSVRLDLGRLVDVKWDIPGDRMEFVHVQTRLFKVEQMYPQPEENILITPLAGEGYRMELCFDQLSAVLGLRLCGKLKYPRNRQDHPMPYFPLSGPALVSWSLEKTEANMRGYHIRAEVQREDPISRQLEVVFNTPGSETDRESRLKFAYLTDPDYNIRFEIVSPWKSLMANMSVANFDHMKYLQMTLTPDGEEYSLKGQLDILTRDQSYTYVPGLTYSTPTKPPTQLLLGSVTWEQDKSLDIDLRGMDIILEGHLNFERAGYKDAIKLKVSNLKVETPLGNVYVNGDLFRDDITCSTSIDINYGDLNHRVYVAGRLQNHSAAELCHYTSSAEVRLSGYPQYNIIVSHEIQHAAGQIENQLTLTYGPDLTSLDKKISLQQVSKYKMDTMKYFHFDNSLSLTYPEMREFFTYEHYIKLDRNNVIHLFNMTYAPGKNIIVNCQVHTKEDLELGYHADVKVVYPGHRMTLRNEMKEMGAGEYKFKTIFDSSPGEKYTVTGMVTLISDSEQLKFGQNATLTIEGIANPFRAFYLIDLHRQMSEGRMHLEWDGKEQFSLKVEQDSRVVEARDISLECMVRSFLASHVGVNIYDDDIEYEMELFLPTYDKRIQGKGEGSYAEGTYWVQQTTLWDADNDVNKKLDLDFVTTWPEDRWSVESILDVTYESEKTSINLRAGMSDNSNDGFHNMYVKVILPSGDRYVTEMAGKLEMSLPKYVGNGKVIFEMPDQYFDLSMDGSLSDGETYLSIITISEARNPQSTHVELSLEISYDVDLPSGRRSLSAKHRLSGDLLLHPIFIELSTSIRPTSVQVFTRWDVFGQAVLMESAGGYSKDDTTGNAQTWTRISVTAPATAWQEFKIDTSSGLQLTSLKFQVNHTSMIQWTYERKAHLELYVNIKKKSWEGKAEITSPNTFTIAVLIDGNVERKIPKFSNVVTCKYWRSGAQEPFQARFELEYENRAEVLIGRIMAVFQNTIEVGSSLKHQRHEGMRSATVFVVNTFRESFTVETDIHYGKSIDIRFKPRVKGRRTNPVTLNIFAASKKENSTRYRLEARLDIYKGHAFDADRDFRVAVEGNSVYSGRDDFHSELLLHVYEYGVRDKALMRVSGSSVGADRQLKVELATVNPSNKEFVIYRIRVIYNTTEEDNTITNKGTINIGARIYQSDELEDLLQLGLLLRHKTYTKKTDGEMGYKTTFVADHVDSRDSNRHTLKLLFEIKYTDREFRPYGHICLANEHAEVGMMVRDKAADDTGIHLDFEASARLYKQSVHHSQHLGTRKLMAVAISGNIMLISGNFEHYFQLDFSEKEENGTLGYRISETAANVYANMENWAFYWIKRHKPFNILQLSSII